MMETETNHRDEIPRRIESALVQLHASGPSVEARAALAVLGERGIPTQTFERSDLLLQRVRPAPETLVVGDLDVVDAALRRVGARYTVLPTYPESLRDLLGRRVFATSLGAVRAEEEESGAPQFVKPRGEPCFSGFVYRDQADRPSFCGAPASTPVWSADPVEFDWECRVYVAKGQIVGVSTYRGRNAPSPASYAAAVLDRLADRPAGFAIDVGGLTDGRTVLVEVNDGFGLALYPGMDAASYVDLLVARWEQIVGAGA